jgi:MFS family permease
MDFATSAVALFEPIYLWTLGFGLEKILLFYAAVYLLYTILVPLGGRVAARFGFEHTILYSQFAFIAYYMCLFGISSWPGLVYVAPVIFAIQKSLYWPAYHADFTLFSGRDQRGREISGVLTVSSIATILGPIFGGLVLNFFGFHALFTVVAMLFLASTRPLLKLKEIHDLAPFSYKKYWEILLTPRHRQSAIAYLGYAEELIALVMWPVFLFVAIPHYDQLGLLVGLSTFITVVLVLLIGKKTDQTAKKPVLTLGSLLLSGSWLFRAFLNFLAWQLVVLDAFGRVAKSMVSIPTMAITYEHGIREDPLAIAVFFEQALAIGKFLMAILMIVLMQFVSPWLAFFVVSALASLLYARLKDSKNQGLVK